MSTRTFLLLTAENTCENCDLSAGLIYTSPDDVLRYRDHRTMFQEQSRDAVAITAPNFLHAPITVAAAEAGCHVSCEKPMARTVPKCWRMVPARQQNNVKLMVGHKRRLRPLAACRS